jgi:hypothetical protein
MSEDRLIDQLGDRRAILQRKGIHVIHVIRRLTEVKVRVQFWSIEENDDSISLANNELYSDVSGHLYTAGGVAKEVAHWAHVKPTEVTLAPEAIDLAPWKQP